MEHPAESNKPRPLQVVLLLGGEGARFSTEGYLRPKVLVNLHGRPMVYWALTLLRIQPEDDVIIAYHKRLSHWQFEDVVKHAIPSIDFKFVQIEFNTRGAAESGVLATKNASPDRPLVFLDGDSLHTENVLGKVRDFYYGPATGDVIRDPASLAVFYKRVPNPAPVFSFVQLDNSTIQRNATGVVHIAEKTVISDNVCIGIYCFPDVATFRRSALKVIDEGFAVKGEFYMSQIYACALRDRSDHSPNPVFGIEVTDFVSVGTPIQVWEYLLKAKGDAAAPTHMQGLRVCFDLDNTLVTLPKVKGDYTTVEPIPHVIAVAQQLKQLGCTIIVFTARRMATHKNNIGKVIKDQGRIVFDTLDKFNIPYDELYFGKPLADFYVDDRAVNPFLRIHEEMGVPNEQNPLSQTQTQTETSFLAVPPRSFHQLKFTPDAVHKTGHSTGMEAQLAFYENVPSQLRGFFPTLLSKRTEQGTTTITLSRARGATLSYVYIFGTLTTGLLDEVIDSLLSLHEWKPAAEEAAKYYLPTDADLYLNWAPKLHQRWATRYDDCYRLFAQSKLIVPRAAWWLEEYQRRLKGSPAHVIHGDAVFTNCVVSADKPRVKFVDMRGSLGNRITTAGDAFYDWAKLLQSLLGYDYVLLGKPNTFNVDYPGLLEHFQKRFVARFGAVGWAWLWALTASFMFTLLPLHMDQPKETQIFYRMGVKWLIHAEELLAGVGHTFGSSAQQPQKLVYQEIFPGETEVC